MRMVAMIVVGLVAAGAAAAADPRPAGHAARGRPGGNGAKSIGTFEDWVAATHVEAGQVVCYAFTRAQAGGAQAGGAQAIPGRSEVVMTVTERPTAPRLAVAVSAGFAYAPNSEAVMTVEKVELPFYTGGRSAFARDGRATVLAFDKGRQAVLRSPGPKGMVVDSFSLRGFTAAYAALGKACGAR